MPRSTHGLAILISSVGRPLRRGRQPLGKDGRPHRDGREALAQGSVGKRQKQFSASRKLAGETVPNTGWHRAFDDPIPLLGGRKLVTLRDAANYITRLPKVEHDTFAWRAAFQGMGRRLLKCYRRPLSATPNAPACAAGVVAIAGRICRVRATSTKAVVLGQRDRPAPDGHQPLQASRDAVGRRVEARHPDRVCDHPRIDDGDHRPRQPEPPRRCRKIDIKGRFAALCDNPAPLPWLCRGDRW
jgi:hypothetical protein